MKKMTHDEFVAKIDKLKGKGVYAILSKYQKATEKILIRHTVCGNEWLIKPSNIYKLKGCRVCHNKAVGERFSKTHDEFEEEVSESTKGEYELLGKYIDSKTKTLIKHLKCGHEFLMAPNKFSFGQRCPKCMRPNYSRDDKLFKNEIFSLVGNDYEVKGNIKRIDQKVLFKHNVCGHEYFATSNKFLNGGRRCPKCANNIKKNTKEYAEYVTTETEGEYKLIGEYDGNRNYAKMLHVKCGHQWKTKPYNFNSGKRCPKCDLSHGEQMVEKWLKENLLNYVTQYRIKECRIIQPLPFDFAIFKDNRLILIEYDGEQHFKAIPFFGGEEAFKKQQERDSFKRKFCKENKIPLIEIPYTIKNINEYLNNELSVYL